MRAHTLCGSVIIGLILGAGCNVLTGADALEVDPTLGEDRAASGGPSGSSPASAAGAGGASSSSAGAGAAPMEGSGGSAGASEPSGAGAGPVGGLVAYAGVSVTEIAFYQGLRAPVMAGGSPAKRSVPIVAGRDALVRVSTSVDGAYDGGPVEARLTVGEGTQPFVVTGAVMNSVDLDLESTLNFEVPGSAITAEAGFRLELGKPGSSGGPPITYPATGFAPLGAEFGGDVLKILLVPIAYGADGSNRLPDTSATQLARYEALFQAMYPVPTVQISLRQPITWGAPLSASGSGWDELLDEIAALREADETPIDVYSYGIFSPASSFGNFCSDGCMAGLGFIASATSGYAHAAIGLGFTGSGSAGTAVHEIGHAHGRAHAPCGVNGDPNFPHDNAAIGVLGFNSAKGALVKASTPDMMGYCDPMWISDYTFSAIFARFQQVSGAAVVAPPDTMNGTYERIRIDGTGKLSWGKPIKLRRPPMGAPMPAAVRTAAGSSEVTASFIPYDHLPGGVLLVRRPELPVQQITVRFGSAPVTLSR